jgi:hypothetical protein
LATALTDTFGQLAQAVAALATTESDTLLQAVLWGDEPGGVFLDFATVVPDHLALVVHELAIRDWIVGVAAPDWMPVRGKALFTALAPRRALAADFLEAFITVESSLTADGAIPGWPHPFPAQAVGALRDALST